MVVDGADQEIPALPGVRTVVQAQHSGPGAARNYGVRHTERRLVLFIGDDMVPVREFIARHLERHRSNTAAHVGVLGRIIWHPSVPRNRLHNWLEWSGALFDYRTLEADPHGRAGWEWFYSSNVSLKRDFFLRADGFDPDFFFDYEDLDFGYRLGRHGLDLMYEPAAVAQHLHNYDWPSVERRYRSRGSAERLMKAKHDWFRPWFRAQMQSALQEPRASRAWSLAVDHVPRRAERLRRAVERRADRYYRQRLAPIFLSAWDNDDGPASARPPDGERK